jgi:hypothetical protein
MAYLTEDDYTLAIGLENLREILAQAADLSGKSEDQIRAFAESYARSYVTSKLKSKYQIGNEYAKDGSSSTSRDMLIVAVTIDLTLCTLHKTINPRDIPELRQKACDAAVIWLNEVRDGITLIDVPVISDGTAEKRTFLGSQIKFISKPFSDASLTDCL